MLIKLLIYFKACEVNVLLTKYTEDSTNPASYIEAYLKTTQQYEQFTLIFTGVSTIEGKWEMRIAVIVNLKVQQFHLTEITSVFTVISSTQYSETNKVPKNNRHNINFLIQSDSLNLKYHSRSSLCVRKKSYDSGSSKDHLGLFELQIKNK